MINKCLSVVQVDWAKEHLEKPIPVKDVFDMNEVVDAVGVTKGKGFKGELITLVQDTNAQLCPFL